MRVGSGGVWRRRLSGHDLRLVWFDKGFNAFWLVSVCADACFAAFRWTGSDQNQGKDARGTLEWIPSDRVRGGRRPAPPTWSTASREARSQPACARNEPRGNRVSGTCRIRGDWESCEMPRKETTPRAECRQFGRGRRGLTGPFRMYCSSWRTGISGCPCFHLVGAKG